MKALPGDLIHYPYRSLMQQLQKTERYARMMAEHEFARGKRASLGKLILSPAWRFWRGYVFRLGFLADFLSRSALIGFLTGVGVQVGAGREAVGDRERAVAVEVGAGLVEQPRHLDLRRQQGLAQVALLVLAT